MADPISIGASILAFISLADKIIRASRHYLATIQDAPTDIEMILGEVSSLKAIIASIGDLAQQQRQENASPRLVSSIFSRGGPVEACRRCLVALQALLPEVGGGDKPHRLIISQLAWPLKESKARKLLAEISHHKATLLLAISGDVSHGLQDIKAELQKLQDSMSDSERREVIHWLERINPSPLHNMAFAKHEPHTSIWLPRLPEWKSWLDCNAPNRFLWIHGLPGAGKTVLASFIIEELRQFCQNSPEGCIYVYYYCHYSHNQDEAKPFLSWVLGQVCRQTRWVPRQLEDLYDRGWEASIPELENILEIVLERLDVLYIVIDAVDESCPREDLLGLIATMVLDKRFRKIRMLATSRPYYDIERLFSGISASISMSNTLVDADIRSFVHTKIAASRRLKRWRHLHAEIEEVLVKKAEGM
ncbi:vegetative incompatibility protein het-e-1 [Podospora didyma]|uniref:Vegetative incompatibility protein het-e-1 n=1 Tax=Podospora didyma TaxID=330526 RepID=A0AAE0TZI3_9PEZI|nr:vegetative incompatibility protein het-e-1 [Podospora didyma]